MWGQVNSSEQYKMSVIKIKEEKVVINIFMYVPPNKIQFKQLLMSLSKFYKS